MMLLMSMIMANVPEDLKKKNVNDSSFQHLVMGRAGLELRKPDVKTEMWGCVSLIL